MAEFVEENWTAPASDDYEISCRRWRPVVGGSRGRVMVLHGIQSHAGWYESLGRILASHGLDVVMPDRRGSGANSADRGHASSTRRLLEDLDTVLHAWNARSDDFRNKPVLAGISWGGKLAAIAVGNRPQTFSGLALITPGLFAKVRPPLSTQLAIAFCAAVFPRKTFSIPLSDPSLFTADESRQHYIATDPATLHEATARFFVVSRAMDIRLPRIARRIHCPTLVQLAGMDRIVNNDRIRNYAKKIAGQPTRIIDYPMAHHTLEFEPNTVAQDYANDLAEWIIDRSRLESISTG
jgi:alpha-beta hydrolase superfamily lysophospholipase